MMANIEGRCITIARVRAGMTSVEVANRLFYRDAVVRMWERGARKPHWDELYALLPELPEIREKGCAAYCPKAEVCKKDGKCPIAYAAKTKRRIDPDVVRVVRCKDCKHSCFVKSCSKYECRKGCGILKFSNDFCSYGERREE